MTKAKKGRVEKDLVAEADTESEASLSSDAGSSSDEESSSGEEVDEFAQSDDDVVAVDLEVFIDDAVVGDTDSENIEAIVELSSKEQSARSLEIRRAIEKRMEERQFHEELDYLDYDLDD